MPTVLITGGSEGIGLKLAERYAKDGWTILLAARDMMKLEDAKRNIQQTFHVPVYAICIDLAKQGAAVRLFESVKDKEIDTVINCAGFGSTGAAIDIDVQKDEEMIGVNVTALMTLSKCFASVMCQKGHGMIVNVASTGAFQPGPYIASYYASKAFVLHYTMALARECQPYGVKVHCLAPGPVATAFYRKEGLRIPRYAMSSERCCAYAYKHFGSRKVVIIPGVLNRLARLLPVSWRMRFVERQKKKGNLKFDGVLR